MDSRVMDLRIRKWITILEVQANSGMNKKEWCDVNGIERTSFFRWQRRVRSYLLEHEGDRGQLQIPAGNKEMERGCFVELPRSQDSNSMMAASMPHYDDASQETHSMCVSYGDFSVHVSGAIDEGQLAAVLRAMKHAY